MDKENVIIYIKYMHIYVIYRCIYVGYIYIYTHTYNTQTRIYVHTLEYYSGIKKEGYLAICDNMGGL